MITRKRNIFLLLAIALAASPGFSQDNGGNPPSNGSSSAANGTGTASAVIYQNSSSKPQFIQAAPGSIPGVFPGYAPENGPCYLYDVQGFPPLTRAIIDSMAKKGKLPHGTRVTIIDPTATSSYEGAIGLMTYNPRMISLSGDEKLAVVIVPGEWHHPDEQLLGVALRELRKAAPSMERAAVINCPEVEADTNVKSWGVGGTYSGTPGGGDAANSVALGISHGSSKSMKKGHSVFYVYALNHGSLDLPAPPPPQKAETPPAPQPQPIPPPQTLRIEVVSVPPPQPIAPPPAPAVVAPSPETPCSTLPKTTVYFGFNLSIVKPEYLPAIRSVEDWMEKNPSCHVVIEGYTSKEASYHYNDGLGGDRSLRVYKIMQRDDPKITDRLTRHVSAGKYFATKDFPNHKDTWQDRKVVFSIRDITSE